MGYYWSNYVAAYMAAMKRNGLADLFLVCAALVLGLADLFLVCAALVFGLGGVLTVIAMLGGG